MTVLEIVLWGIPDEHEAVAAVEEFLGRAVRW
jgi:hypothetical protein